MFKRSKNNLPQAVAKATGNIPAPQESFQVIDPSEKIEFTITDTDAIYEDAENGQKGNIARTLLENPVDSVTLQLKTDEAGFKLNGSIDYGTNKEKTQEVLGKLRSYLAKRAIANDSELVERGGVVIVEGDAGTQVVVGQGKYYGDERKISITTGELSDEGYENTLTLLPPLDVDRKIFDNALSDVMGIMAAALYMSYEENALSAKQTIAVGPVPKKERDFDLPSFAKSEKPKAPKDIKEEFGAERPKVSFDEIGGQEKAKEELKSLAFALSHPELYKKWGTKPPKGVLLYGAPGTGKTLLAKALASEADAAFYSITANDITSKWYGEAEKRAQGVFDAAADNERAIIYIDEIDGISPNRDGAHEATQRVASVILQNMDGMHAQDHVMIVAATNRMNSMDPAMLRPGRFDRLIEVALPDNEAREQIFSIHINKANELAERTVFSSDVSSQKLAELTAERSGADIAEVIRRTLEKKVRQEALTGEEPSLVSLEDIQAEISEYERAQPSE